MPDDGSDRRDPACGLTPRPQARREPVTPATPRRCSSPGGAPHGGIDPTVPRSSCTAAGWDLHTRRRTVDTGRKPIEPPPLTEQHRARQPPTTSSPERHSPTHDRRSRYGWAQRQFDVEHGCDHELAADRVRQFVERLVRLDIDTKPRKQVRIGDGQRRPRVNHRDRVGTVAVQHQRDDRAEDWRAIGERRLVETPVWVDPDRQVRTVQLKPMKAGSSVSGMRRIVPS